MMKLFAIASLVVLLGTVASAMMTIGTTTTNLNEFDAITSGSAACAASDAQMSKLRQITCRSFVGPTTPWCESDKNVQAAGDWPHQSVYLLSLLKFMVAPTTCLNTTYAANTFEWLNGPMSNVNVGGSFMNTWVVFQPGYYNMPRKPGNRIESPWTLGEKCWAFSFLDQKLNPTPLAKAAATVGQSIANFTANYNKAAPLTMNLCVEVKNNCFVNASYNPSRAGHCKVKVEEFKLGWDYENLKFGNLVKYPF